MADPSVLIVPGWNNSGPEHWQTLWERADPLRFRRVEQDDWDSPTAGDWTATLDRAVHDAAGPVLLVAHSLGVVTIARWVATYGAPVARRVRGALLVAPADTEQPDTPTVLRSFAPMPRTALPFPSILVASTDDPYARLERVTEFAAWWGARLEVMPGAGHINTAAGFGAFPAGERWLAELTAISGSARGAA